MEPGIYPDISNKEYHSTTALSKGGLVSLSRSPSHMHTPSKQIPAFRTGTIAHHSALQRDIFDTRYVVAPEVNKRTKAGKAELKEFEESLAPGQEIITQDEMDMFTDMSDALWNHPQAAALMSGGIAEQSVFWDEPQYGFLCKCRPDYLIGRKVCVDYKTTVDASPKSFAKSIANFAYHLQVEWYTRGLREIGKGVERFIFIAQEKTPPYAVACYECDQKSIDHASKQIDSLLEIYANCEAFDDWPGYSEEIVELSMPGWAYYS